jgi:ABC-type oligopeptide transport system ATPase subunit
LRGGAIMSIDIEESFRRFTAQKGNLEQITSTQINEAATRFQVLDELLVGVLGWERKNIDVEYSVGTNNEDEAHKKLFADYLMHSTNNKFLVEAKRTGRYFELPNTSIRKYSSDGVLKSSFDNAKFIDQCHTYMTNLGIPFCVLTNGKQFVVIRQKVFANVKDVIVFRNYDEIEKFFIVFWNLLSPLSVGWEYLDSQLSIPDEVRQRPEMEKKPLEAYIRKHEQVQTGNIRTVTEKYIGRFFGDLTQESQKALLRDCYCDPSGRFTTFADGLKNEILPQKLSAIQKVTIKNYYGEKGNFEEQYVGELKDEVGTVFVLVGGVGAGKSTFVKHFYDFQLTEQTRGQIVWVNIDLLQYNGPIEEVNVFITHKIEEALKTNYKHLSLDNWEILKEIYADLVEETLAGMPPFLKEREGFAEEELWKQISAEKSRKEVHLAKVLKYLRSTHNIRACLVFDNVDQKAAVWQESVLLISIDRAKQYGAVIITSLRLENYFVLKETPVFDAIEPNVFRIEPPGVKELLKKRIEALSKYPQENFKVEVPPNFTFSVPLEKFVRVLDNTLTAQDGRMVEVLLENLSSGNMRRALKLFRTFIQSGNTKLYELIRTFKKVESVKVDYDYVFDSLVLKDNVYYNSDDSEVYNVFNYYDDGYYSHFTQLYLLTYLDKMSKYSERNSYIGIDELLERFRCIFANRERLMCVLEPLLKNYLINSDYGERSRLALTNSISLSPLGSYYISELVYDWRYLFYVAIDTYYSDPGVARAIRRLYETVQRTKQLDAKIKVKKVLVDTFLNYLDEREKVEVEWLRKVYKTLPFTPLVETMKNTSNHAVKKVLVGE